MSEAADILRNMSIDMGSMFSEVEKLVSTMSQSRPNSVAVSHCHQDLLDHALDMHALIKDFVGRSDVRIKLFGKL